MQHSLVAPNKLLAKKKLIDKFLILLQAPWESTMHCWRVATRPWPERSLRAPCPATRGTPCLPPWPAPWFPSPTSEGWLAVVI